MPIRFLRTCGCERVQNCVLRSEEHTSELQSRLHLVCRLLLETKEELASLRVTRVSSEHSGATALHSNLKRKIKGPPSRNIDSSARPPALPLYSCSSGRRSCIS